MKVPLRLDFAGGWLDVPRFAVPGAFVVNMAISPLVFLDGERNVRMDHNHLHCLPLPGSGLGTSAAWHLLNGRDALAEELAAGAGWQDPAVIQQTGLCVWASMRDPVLVHHESGDWLKGLLAIHWTGKSHCTADISNLKRDYNRIANASIQAFRAVRCQDVEMLATAIDMSAEQQYEEGMDELPLYGLAAKYCGAGHGGYAVYLFDTQECRDRMVWERGMVAVEPYCQTLEIKTWEPNTRYEVGDEIVDIDGYEKALDLAGPKKGIQ